jgi:hypothetical protein
MKLMASGVTNSEARVRSPSFSRSSSSTTMSMRPARISARAAGTSTNGVGSIGHSLFGMLRNDEQLHCLALATKEQNRMKRDDPFQNYQLLAPTKRESIADRAQQVLNSLTFCVQFASPHTYRHPQQSECCPSWCHLRGRLRCLCLRCLSADSPLRQMDRRNTAPAGLPRL